MRNRRFKFTAVIVAALGLSLLTHVTVEAQSMSAPTAVTLTAALAASSASNLNVVVDCRYQSTVPLMIKLQNDGTASGAINFVWAYTGDGNNYDLTRTRSLPIVPSGTSTNYWFTNVPTFGAMKMKLLYWTNADAAVNCTNASLSYVLTKGLGY
jgi:hypothetical protein